MQHARLALLDKERLICYHQITKKKEGFSMKFCSKCGKELEDNAAFCVACGAPQASAPAVAPAPVSTPKTDPNDASSFGFGVLGFFIPLAGLILWLMWRDETPKKAKSAGIGALIGFICNIGLTIFFYIIYFAIMMAGYGF
jgi:hypothetical protein